MNPPLRITFLGTGTSTGVPMLCCQCQVCTSNDPRDRRLRSSLLIRSDNTTIVIDCGPDFRQQMLTHHVDFINAIIFTHEHKDHTAGLDEIRPYNFIHRYPMPLYASQRVLEELRKQYAYIFESTYPGLPQVTLHAIEPGCPFQIGDIELLPIQAHHYKMPVLGFRIDNFAYMTDVKTISDDQWALLEGVDTLVISALRRESHIAHLTLEEALEWIERLAPRNAYLTHISHLLGCHADVESELPPHVHLAYDGLTIE